LELLTTRTISTKGQKGFVHLCLDCKDSILAPPDSFCAAQTAIRISRAGFWANLKNRFFPNPEASNLLFSSEKDGAELILSCPGLCEIVPFEMKNESFLVRAQSIVAYSPTLKARFKKQRFSSDSADAAIFFSGSGTVWLGAAGGAEQVDVSDSLALAPMALVGHDPVLSVKQTDSDGMLYFTGTGKVLFSRRLASNFRPEPIRKPVETL
jgi:uncharacterized protein (AIM24 family)